MLRVFNVVKWTPLNGSSGGSVLGVTPPTCSVSHYYKPFLLWSLKWSEVAQSCPTLCDPMDCSLSGSSVHGIFQARVLEWVAISFSRGSSQPRNRTRVSCIAGRRFTVWATREAPREAQKYQSGYPYPFSRGSSQPRNRIAVSCIAGGFFPNHAIREALC